jgi:hypothetical protein
MGSDDIAGAIADGNALHARTISRMPHTAK